MKTLHHNAAALLFEKVRSLGAQAGSWRCIYLNLSERCRPELRAHFVVPAVTDLLQDADGYIYLCDDGDIFILFQGALRPVLSRLGRHFEELTPVLPGQQPQDSMFTVFDLSRHGALLLQLCQAKATHARPAKYRAWRTGAAHVTSDA